MKNRDFAQEGKWQERQRRQREYKAEQKTKRPEDMRVESAGDFPKRITGTSIDFLIFDEFSETMSHDDDWLSWSAPSSAVATLDPGSLSYSPSRREFSRNETSRRSVAAWDIGKLDLTCPRRFHKSTFLKSMTDTHALIPPKTCDMPQFNAIEIDWKLLAQMRKEREAEEAIEDELLRPVRESLGYGEW